MTKIYLTNSPAQTKKLGKILAGEILKSKPAKRAVILGLIGDLGGGKTTFLQGFAKGLGIKQKILSPTFIIMRKSKIPRSNPSRVLRSRQNTKSSIENFYHIDCYRIRKPKEILDLDLEKIVSNPGNIIAIEWAEKMRKILPKGSLILKFDFIDENKRKIVFQNPYSDG